MSAASDLERGRDAYARQAWADSHRLLASVDAADPLGPEDLELWATSAYMIGREAEYLELLERAYGAHLGAGSELLALRCAFWIGVHLARQGEMGRAGGWLGRAGRILEREGGDLVERGYLLLPRVFEQEASGDLEAAAATAGEAAAIGERFGDPDLFALAAHTQGHILIRLGDSRRGLGLLDEAMVSVTAGELSAIPSGIVYCGVILACQEAHAVGRAAEWTAALSDWCERQPDLVAFTGRCLIHRAEIMQLRGAWREGLEEASRARERCLRGENPVAAGEACYRQGEISRLGGDFGAAEDAYRDAGRQGREPQPGLALLRLAQGKADVALTGIQRALAEARGPADRTSLLAAAVEIRLAADASVEAREACDELRKLASGSEAPMLEAMAATARGAVALAEGDAGAALATLRRGSDLWQELEAPYERARVRVLVGLACRALGDEEAAVREFDVARDTFRWLGAAPDLERIPSLAGPSPDTQNHGLTGRELEVLRLAAGGKSNREIASELVISEHTVARHLQNIFAKLGVSSRTAATAFAFEHELL